MGCGICRVLYEELMACAEKDLGLEHESHEEQPPDHGKDKSEAGLSAQSTALLGVINDIEDEDVFRLDFKLEWNVGERDPSIVKRTFVLKQTGSPIAAFRTPISGETSSSEVFKLALSWITQCDTKCECAKLEPVWYPTRLIDIRGLKSQTYLDTRRKQYTGRVPKGTETLQDLDKITVKLVERNRDNPSHGLDVFGKDADPTEEESGHTAEDAGHTKQPNNLYVTLSHCWGQSQHYTLNPRTIDDLKEGIEVEKLPKTFRDAIGFASQLHNVGWIWIDSLCIYQDGPDMEKDWLHEAALMQRVYRESYLNISATAASNSGVGLYSERDCRTLWENEVSLKVEGIPGLALHGEDHEREPEKEHEKEHKEGHEEEHEDEHKEKHEDEHHHNHQVKTMTPKKDRSCWTWVAQLFRAPPPERCEKVEPAAKTDLEPVAKINGEPVAKLDLEPVAKIEREPIAKIDWGGGKPLTLALPEPEGLRRCVLIDTSHWDNLVNKAPVNVRAWVLQERLLAPRVLHFCKGSIAWECGGFTRAEGHPTGLPKFQLQHDRILPEVSLKGLDPFKHGKDLRKIRLGDSKEPDPHIPKKDLYGFELWARVVEIYSRMNLTMAKDKLIALSGIAQLMSTDVLGSKEDPARYVAGLWYKYLESQLLWRVEPIFIRQNRTFQQPGKRPREFKRGESKSDQFLYRAPSFSWASVDAQKGNDDQPGNGITFGEVTDRDLLIELQKGPDNVVIKQQTDNAFGLVTSGHIMIHGKLRKIRLSKGERGRFYWRLLERNAVCSNVKIDEEKHHNVYLDAPDDDHERYGIFEADNVFCLPAAKGPRTEDKDSKYIICLILQQADGDEQVKGLNRLEQKGTFRRIGMTKLSGWGDKHTYEHILKHLATDTQLPHWPFGFDDQTHRHLIRII